MGDVVHAPWGADQLLAHVFTHLHVNFPKAQGATVGYWPLETHDRANDVDDRSKGPGIGSTILDGEGMRDLNGADDGAVWQAHLVWRVSQRAQQRMLGLVRAGLRACVEHVPPWLHPKVTVLDALDALQNGVRQHRTAQCEAMCHRTDARCGRRLAGRRGRLLRQRELGTAQGDFADAVAVL